MTPPNVLANGFTEIERDKTPDSRQEVVLAFYPASGKHPTEYATWVVLSDRSTIWGHYSDTLEKAVEDYRERLL